MGISAGRRLEELFFRIFGGYQTPKKNKAGEWFIGANLVLNLNDYIPLPIPAELSQITDVKVRLRSDDGYVIAEPYGWVYDGLFWFNEAYAGHFGEIIFVDEEGNQFAYDIETGARLSEDEVICETEITISNYREMVLDGGKATDKWAFSIEDVEGKRQTAPVYRLVVNTQTTFNVSTFGYYFEEDGVKSLVFSERAWVERVGDDFETEVLPITFIGHFQFELSPGTYWIRFEYDSIETPTTPSYGGGKG